MPLQSGIPVCINHPTVLLLRNSGLSAVTSLERAASGEVAFNPSVGVPVVMYYCEICGYIEMYAAQKTPYWESEKKKS
jgi:hypothetical protein